MSEEYLVKYCAPTMAGIKTGSLFSCTYSSREELAADLKAYNAVFMPRGLFLIPLQICQKRVLFYLFRKDRLSADLSNGDVSRILTENGYPSGDYRSCLSRLIRRLKEADGFPHEIGLFLSYPPEDVRGFVENGASHCKLVGYWKVYGDEKKAKRIFREYDRCTCDYRARIRQGAELEKLIVPCAL
ncbi:MAG: DUF3793 family protein [Lachnospiraceae bacterium]|nr:DUF3793 family protein [Lachnospiraceae bacterium]